MKICVYAICKNESAFVDTWMESMREADEVIVLDTGSQDDTAVKLRQAGAKRYFRKKSSLGDLTSRAIGRYLMYQRMRISAYAPIWMKYFMRDGEKRWKKLGNRARCRHPIATRGTSIRMAQKGMYFGSKKFTQGMDSGGSIQCMK